MSWPSSDPVSNTQDQNMSKSPQLRAPSTDLQSPQMGISKGSEASSPSPPSQPPQGEENMDSTKISAYARLDFDQYTFFVQTLQVVLGRKSSQEFLSSAHHSVDVHLSSKKAISRRHAKIFYNFGTQRFEISVLGRNGAFVDDSFVAKGITVPLKDTTKIQIGDIPFTFVLPSLEAAEAEDARHPSAKLFNPTDALNLRSNLYSTTGSNQSPKRNNTPKSVSISAPTQPPQSEKKDAAAVAALARRNSKADIVRRLSIARRKSLASSSNDEINALLKELETFNTGGETSISQPADAPFDPELLDADVKNLLHTSVAELSYEQLQKEEDEIDALVKQHNLSEGVVLQEHQNESPQLPQDLAMDINMLDQEVASLAPLMDANTLNMTDDALRKPHMATAFPITGPRSGISKTNSLQHLDSSSLMGKPLGTGTGSGAGTGVGTGAGAAAMAGPGPRMGKPATIQPPANRIYGRPSAGAIGSIGSMGGMPAGIPGQIPGQMPAHLSAVPGALPPQLPPGYAVTVPPGYPPYNAYGTSPYTTLMRPPPPKLEVPVEPITSVPIVHSIVPFRAITVESQAQAKPPVCVYKSAEKPSGKPKIPVRRKDSLLLRKSAAKMQNPKDIPDQYKAKPTVTISAMISTVLRATSAEKKGFTISEIHEKIRELFPYYRYCPDGWQFPVTHNVKFNKTFHAVHKPELPGEWLYAIDHAYVEEKEKIRKKQQEAAMARAKEAAMRTVDYRSRPPASMQYGSHLGRPYMATDAARFAGSSATGIGIGAGAGTGAGPGGASLSLGVGGGINTVNGLQRPKSIAEIASEIKREGQHAYTKPPLYFQRKPADPVRGPDLGPNSPDPERFSATIKDQLAANRAKPASSSSSLGSPIPVPQLGKPPSSLGATGQFKGRPPAPKPSNMSGHVSAPVPAVKAPVPVSAQAKTAMAAKTPLPNSTTTAASTTTTNSNSSTATPTPARQGGASTPMNADTKKSLGYLQKELFTLYKARNLTYNTTVTTEIITKALATTIAQVNIIGAKAGCGENALSFLVEKAPQQVSKILDIALTKSIKEKQGGGVSGQNSRAQTPQPAATAPSSAAASAAAKNSESRPSSTTPNTGTPTPAVTQRMPYSGLSKPQSFTKPGGLAKPPQFVSNKPRPVEKRPSDEAVPDAKKVMKIED